jgi:hypothetical protein
VTLARALRACCGIALVALTACGGIGGNSNPSFAPQGPIEFAPFGQNPVTTSASAPLVLAHGTSTSFHVTEDIYTGTYTTAEVANPPGSTCITLSPAVVAYVFTVTVGAAPGCVYPQTAAFTFTDVIANTATLYVEGT